MSLYGLPVLFALFVWWFSTGIVLYLIGLPRRTVPGSMAAATAVLSVGLYGLWETSTDASMAGAYLAFASALLVWAWHEMSFLTGVVTGPRTTEHPERTSPRARFWPAVETVLYHELAILLTAAVVFALTWNGANQVGLWTFVVLWVMRLSAKVNVYLGVPNLTEEFLPPHLTYLKTYFCRRPMNLFFPVAVTASIVVTVLLAQTAIGDAASDFNAVGYTLLATLMALAVIEHWFLVVPLPAAALWSWGMASRADQAPSAEVTATPPRAKRLTAAPAA